VFSCPDGADGDRPLFLLRQDGGDSGYHEEHDEHSFRHAVCDTQSSFQRVVRGSTFGKPHQRSDLLSERAVTVDGRAEASMPNYRHIAESSALCVLPRVILAA
jgi:hypothetical protein